jgi:hypothetical protein
LVKMAHDPVHILPASAVTKGATAAGGRRNGAMASRGDQMTTRKTPLALVTACVVIAAMAQAMGVGRQVARGRIIV